MTLAELLTKAREDFLDDAVAPQRWSDTQLKRFALEAMTEACKRADLLQRVDTIAVTATTEEYALEPYVKQIKVAKLDLSDYPLNQTTESELSLFTGSSWRITTGTPTHYVRIGSAIRLYPIPIVDDSLVIASSGLPEDDGALDLINPEYHYGLLHYMAFKARNDRDLDKYDPVKAKEHLADFNDFFGLPKSAKYSEVAKATPMYGTMFGGRMA